MYRIGPPRLQSRESHTFDRSQGGPTVPDPIPGGSPAQLRSLFLSFFIDLGLILDHVLSAEHIAAVVAQELGNTRVRSLAPLVTLTFFLARTLSNRLTC